MPKEIVLALAGVVALGVAAQWLAWRLRVASILLLLAAGFAIGPAAAAIFGRPLLDPDALLGDLLLPFVSLSVALILYEGGLSLRFRELQGGGRVLWRLVTLGAAITWVLAALAAHLIVGLPGPLAVLLGAVLVVTGPTVIIPLLREIRPKGPAGAIAKWEGIIIDPIGAMLAVLVFEAIVLGGLGDAAGPIALIIGKTAVIGGGLGVAAGVALALLLRAYWVPDHLVNPLSLMLVLGVYAAAEQLQHESGLLAATAMGMTLANQRWADVREIAEFKENLRVLLLSMLFVLLSARVQPQTLQNIGWQGAAFVAALVLIVRPASVLVCTLGTSLPLAQRVFLSLIAPRGIVAASVAAVFALQLMELGFEQARAVVPLTFLTIVGTVLFSSIVGPIAARRLGLSEPNPQGVLMAGANDFARALAETLKAHGFRALLVDTNRDNVVRARLAGLEAREGSVTAEELLDEADWGGIGRLLAVTPNNAVNVLAAGRLARVFGRNEIYQIAPPAERTNVQRAPDTAARGRILFSRDMTWQAIESHLREGYEVKATRITPEFTYEMFRQRSERNDGGNGGAAEPATPLMIVADKRLIIITDDSRTEPRPGQIIIALTPPRVAAATSEP